MFLCTVFIAQDDIFGGMLWAEIRAVHRMEGVNLYLSLFHCSQMVIGQQSSGSNSNLTELQVVNLDATQSTKSDWLVPGTEGSPETYITIYWCLVPFWTISSIHAIGVCAICTVCTVNACRDLTRTPMNWEKVSLLRSDVRVETYRTLILTCVFCMLFVRAWMYECSIRQRETEKQCYPTVAHTEISHFGQRWIILSVFLYGYMYVCVL